MRKYTLPEIEMIELEVCDIITTSPGTESSIIENEFGIWDLELN